MKSAEEAREALAAAVADLPLTRAEQLAVDEYGRNPDLALLLTSIITKARATEPTSIPSRAPRVDGHCSWCREPMPVPVRPQKGGRTKRFCSAACRQAEYRWRKNPDRYADREQWVTARKGMFSTWKEG